MPRYSIRDLIRAVVIIVLVILVTAAITLGAINVTQVAAEEIRKRRRFKAKNTNQRIEVQLSEDEQMISYSIILKNLPKHVTVKGWFTIDDRQVHQLKLLCTPHEELHCQGIWRSPSAEVVAAMREGRLRADIWFDGQLVKLNII